MAESNDKEIILQQPDNALAFRASISNIFQSVAEYLSEEEFMEYLTFLKSKASMTRKLRKAMVDDLQKHLNVELEDILADGNFSEGLGKLKELMIKSSQKPDHIAWRPPGNVLEHLRSHDAEKIHKEHERLQRLVDELEAENNKLKEQIAEKRTAVQKIDDRVNRASKTGSLTRPHMETASDCMQKYIEILYNKN